MKAVFLELGRRAVGYSLPSRFFNCTRGHLTCGIDKNKLYPGKTNRPIHSPLKSTGVKHSTTIQLKSGASAFHNGTLFLQPSWPGTARSPLQVTEQVTVLQYLQLNKQTQFESSPSPNQYPKFYFRSK